MTAGFLDVDRLCFGCKQSEPSSFNVTGYKMMRFVDVNNGKNCAKLCMFHIF